MRLIDADALKPSYVVTSTTTNSLCHLYVSIEDINSVPTVDAVPVVRCKDCKHHHYSVCEIPYCDRIDYGYGWKDEDFCSAGERKDGDHHDD